MAATTEATVRWTVVALSLALAAPFPTLASPHASCPNHNPERNAYFRDLHVHTAFSADAVIFDTTAEPDDAYRYAFEGWILLPPLDAEGRPTRRHENLRPLDFMAVTDHAEMLGEVGVCTDEASPGYERGGSRAAARESQQFGATGLCTWALASPRRLAAPREHRSRS